MHKRKGQYGIKVIAAVAALVAGGGSLLFAAMAPLLPVGWWAWNLTVSFSLVSYFGYILRRDMELEQELDAVDSKLNELLASMVEVVAGNEDYSEVVVTQSSHVDQSFWSTFTEALHGDAETYVLKPWITQNAAKDSDVAVPKRLAYQMMQVMLDTLGTGDEYLATVTAEELLDLDAALLFDSAVLEDLKERDIGVTRILLVAANDLEDLDESVLENVRRQIGGGVKFFCLKDGYSEERNFGLYGNRCVGQMVAGWNTFRFAPDYISKSRKLWEYLRRYRVRELESKDLQRGPEL